MYCLSLSLPLLSRHQTNYQLLAQGIVTMTPRGHSPTTRPERLDNKLSVSSGLSSLMILVSATTTFISDWGDSRGMLMQVLTWGVDRSDRLPLLPLDQLVRPVYLHLAKHTPQRTSPLIITLPLHVRVLSYQNHRRYVLSLDTDQLRGEQRSL